ncbi:potassium channel family protein [Christiangramia portivictoriae]|uniref:potassium channel family protein n=1 Tax=Christiangramia portivictoriae TaxID=326069 RepID=UPI00041C86B6|nr:potassium channel family protein [Christiangramia portivictoriae]
MNLLYFGIGAIIVLVTIYDMIYTILSPRGSAFIADRISRWFWRFALKITGKNGKNRLLEYVGPLILLGIVLTWIIILWLGNTLIVYSDPQALWSAQDNAYVSGFFNKLYFAAYVLSSMGNGDYTPASDWWLFFTGFISYTGVVFISLGISFLIPVVEGITLKRKLSMQIHNLGETPEKIITNYKDDNFNRLSEALSDLEAPLLKVAQSHLAYPVIHYFHSINLYESLPVQLATLDETLSILLYQVEEDHFEDRRSIERTYKSLTYYLSTLASAFIHPNDDEPEHPDTNYLQDLKKSDQAINDSANRRLANRRKLLLAYLQNDGWQWDVIEKTEKVTIEEMI